MGKSVQGSNKSTARWASKIELLLNSIFLLSDFELQQRGSRQLRGHLVRQVCSQFAKGIGGRIFNNSNRQQRRFLTGSNPSGGKANKLGTYIILAFYKHTGWLSIGLITLSWLTPFQFHRDSQSSCSSSGIDLLWGNLLAGRLPCSPLSSSSTRLLPGLLLPAHICSSFLELFHGQCNGRNIKNETLLKVSLLRRVRAIASTILTMHRQQHQTRTKRKTSDLSFRVGFISS